MDAHALLSSQGWRGTGHSLHKTDDSIGLAKPLLLNRKDNTKGLGQKQHFTSDQWWMNAFDEQLKGIDTSKKGKVVQTVTTGKLNVIDKNLGKYSVYSTFVRGGFLEGTIDRLNLNDSSTESSETDSSDQKDSNKSNKDKPRKETKEEKRVRKEEKKKRKEARAERRAAKAARRELKKSKKSSKSSRSSKSSAESSDADEEKRRRRAKKEEKRRQRAKEAGK
ncbi:DNA-directed rna polymerase ii subunit rpb1 [Fusarium sporotrichioides]|uniref:DNA-directed rna polymerase ii subunit rpb1 n=1 Tax=Fusarium sporotrichioides TaxID=5514 RepID=A0A395S8E8_FUSSP|nr:DNA-directed rna polymerase ii subunit rpb1 [Fusarium sporotrichioides]